MEYIEAVGSGRKCNQRMKQFLVLEYLLKNTDAEHFVKADDIAEALKGKGVPAERRSVYKDIKEINAAFLVAENELNFDDALTALELNPDLGAIRYKHNCGYYVAKPPLGFDDAQLICECIYTARFLSEKQADTLVGKMTGFLSKSQVADIKHEMFAVDRFRLENESVFKNVRLIQSAISKTAAPPKKIRFRYTYHILEGSKLKLKERGEGKKYTVTPYSVLINDGNYYMLAISDNAKTNDLLTFRIDRMSAVFVTEIDGVQTEQTKDIDGYLSSYTKRVFSMYGGERVRVEIRFTKNLLDTMDERFGNTATYMRDDDNHYILYTEVELSPTFYGWLTGFGSKVKLLSPTKAVEGYQKHIEKIISLYKHEKSD